MPATELPLSTGETAFRKYTDSKPLRELEGKVVELNIRFCRSGHVNIAGRVRIVEATPAVWVGTACLPYDVEVYEDNYDRGTYVCEVRGL